MLQRAALIIALMLLTTFALQGCWPGYYYSLQLQKVGGRPYLVVGHSSNSIEHGEKGLFSIYTPKDKSWEEWEPLFTDRLGQPTGAFLVDSIHAPAAAEVKTPETSPPAKDEKVPPLPAPERLGIFHPRRATFIDVSPRPVTQTLEILPFSWIAETAATLNGATYAFGADLQPVEGAKPQGPLKVAKFQDNKWEELKLETPTVHSGKGGFSLQCVEFQNTIKIFWREAEPDQALGPIQFDGLRIVTGGPLTMATFDGGKITGPPVAINNLPRGNTTVWADGAEMKVLIQTRLKLQDALSNNGPLEIWKFSDDGTPTRLEAVEGSSNKAGLLSFIVADRVNWDGQEFIIRSNWQMFEVWSNSPDSGWRRIVQKPKGLPVYDLETPFLGFLGMGLALVVFGAGLAYHRRKQALTLVRKIQPQEIYAPLGLRCGAYAVDLTLITAMTLLLVYLRGQENADPARMMEFGFSFYAPYYGIYLAYMAGAEWLFGATPGKYMMGLCVVMDGGEKPTFWAALIRNVLGIFERSPYVFILIALPMIIIGPRRQRLGDLLARTIVAQRGTLEVYKIQRLQEIEKRRAEEKETKDLILLPPIRLPWDKKPLAGDKENASSDKEDKGGRP